MADNKISPLYTNLIDYLDTYNASVYKHHKTGNVIHLWVKQTKFNYDFDRDIKKAVYDYFKDIIGFFLPGNVKIDNMTQGNHRLTVTIPKGHEAKLLTVSEDELKDQKVEVTDIMRSVTSATFDNVTYRINCSSRHIRVYSIPVEHIATYIQDMYQLFSSKGWLVYRFEEFNDGGDMKNIHFFYKRQLDK